MISVNGKAIMRSILILLSLYEDFDQRFDNGGSLTLRVTGFFVDFSTSTIIEERGTWWGGGRRERRAIMRTF